MLKSTKKWTVKDILQPSFLSDNFYLNLTNISNRQKGKIRYLINFSHIEDWNVSKKSQVVCRIKNGTEPVVKRKIREPEHGRAEPVEEVLDQLVDNAVG